MLTLRPYQSEAVQAAYRHLREHDDNPCVVIPTAGGKSLVMAAICRDAVGQWNGRVLILAHVKELLEQTVDKLDAVAPEMMLQVGVYSAGLKSRDTEHPVIVAGIQSVYRRACELGAFDLIIVDEAHLIPPDGEGMYRTFLQEARVVNPNVRVIGMTATPFRMTTGHLCGPENILNAVCYEVGIRELIVQGYLCPLISKAGREKVDTDDLHIRAGEFVASEVEDLMDQDALVEAACREIISYNHDRKSCLVFSSGVDHGVHVAGKLVEMGQHAETVFGDTLDFERSRVIEDFKAGRLKYLVNVNVLSTGFDAPNIDCVAMLRPTLSPGLYYQMVGRGFRLHPGKENCIAEGQRVLTDCGPVPIERVTPDMRVWDGTAFVHHAGIVCRGEQEVIDYAGLAATPDHKVWTEKGWKTLGECALEQTPVSVTGVGRQVIREADGYFRRGSAQGVAWQAVSAREMPDVRRALTEVPYESDASHRRLSQVRTATACPEMACSASVECEGPLLEFRQSEVPGLRRAGDRISIRDADHNGGMGSGEPWASPRHANRQNRQRRSLRVGQSTVCDSQGEHAQHASMCQRMRVWDILNAGPRHRFTCEGILVSNCVVLDFGGNILRHGPVDDIRVKEPGSNGGGEAPAKECPQCHSVIALGYAICPDCGYAFPAPERQQHEAEASTAGILSGQVTATEHPVQSVSYAVHVKRDAPPDAPRTMRVEYRIGEFWHKSEWICLEHTGFARHKAELWWKRRSNAPVPETAEEAVVLAEGGALCETISITVRRVAGEKYDTIVGCELGEKPSWREPGEDEEPCAEHAWIGDAKVPF